MKTLAVAILTKNEEHNIVDVIKNVRQCTDEILIIDSGSTDKTVELAKKNGAKVFYRAWTNDFAAQRNFALDKTSADWILYIDADERLSTEAVEHTKKILTSEDCSFQYRFKRITSAFGKQFKHGALGSDYVTRLFPRTDIQWIGKVHESAKCNLKLQTAKGYLSHQTYTTWSQWASKMEQYSTIWATDAYAHGKRTSAFGVFAHSTFSFFKMFFLNAGFLDAWYGWFSCINYAHYTQMKYLKLLELQTKN